MFDAVRRSYEQHKRAGGRIGFAVERAVNFVNRARCTAALSAHGVPFFSEYTGGRWQLYGYVFSHHVVAPVDYLEFGVAQGHSMRWALAALGSDSRLFGFDSFQGLPGDWYHGVPRGAFSNHGVPPPITAPNVRFIRGWFEETLEPFLETTVLRTPLVVHMDADLYAPTRYVLRTLESVLVAGTIVVFDEYWFVKDEFRAFDEFVRETGKTFRYLALSEQRAAIEFTA